MDQNLGFRVASGAVYAKVGSSCRRENEIDISGLFISIRCTIVKMPKDHRKVIGELAKMQHANGMSYKDLHKNHT